MCGFAGEIVFAGSADADLAVAMAQRLVHRGPDAAGVFASEDGRCAIGFRRLAVIDPSGSDQPMSLPDGKLTVAFNGEIYNYRQLRDQLRADGAVFSSEGDTEVILHLYRRLGSKMLESLDGMFSLAVYDTSKQTLLLARDRLGQKPLWYAPLPGRVVFASEAKALLLHPDVGRHVAMEHLTTYCTMGYMPAPHTPWRDILKLPPASSLTISTACGRPEQYWQLEPGDEPADFDESVEAVRNGLSRAVEARMVADVPLGALLSGGVDSAVITALMCKAAGKAGGVRTFTAGFEDPAYDERSAAAKVAAHCGTDHTELLIRPDVADGALLDQLVDMYDEPFADSSALPTFLICQAAREHVTVALAGDGGDEVFAGYDRYRAMHMSQTMSPLRYTALRAAAALLRPFASHNERSASRRLVRFASALPQPPATQYLTYRAIFATADLARLFTPEFAADNSLNAPAEWFCDLYEQGDFDSEVTRSQRHDLLTYLPDDLLVKTDIASMASSLELRAPMLDHRVVQLGLSLPVSAKIAGGRGKAILRHAFADILPPEVFQLPKRGFGVPLGKWLREDLRETLCETLLDDNLAKRGIFRPEALAGLINDHVTGRADHCHRLWALLMFARWLNRNES